MNKEKLLRLLIEKHQNAATHLEDLAFRYNIDRYLKKDFQEGYKFALLEMQKLIETINAIYFDSPKVDREFLESMRAKQEP